MGEAEATMEARLTAITASLKEAHTLLASCARRLGVKEQGRQAATTSLFAATTTSLSAPDRVRMQPEIKPSPPVLISTHQVVAALGTDTFLVSAAPTRCSTVGSTVNVGSNHAAVAFPRSDTTPLCATTSGNNTLGGVVGFVAKKPVGCSTHVLYCPPDDPGARALDVDTDLSVEMLTHVGGLSLFEELELDSADEVFSDSPLREMVWDEEVADSMLTHIGSSSLFPELGTGTNQELQGHAYSNHGVGVPSVPCGTMIVKLEKVQYVNINQCIHRLGHTRLELAGNLDVVLNCSLWPTEELDRLSSSWDPVGSRFTCLVLSSITFAGHTLVYSMNSLLMDSIVWEDSMSVFLAIECYVQWDPGVMHWSFLDNLKLDETYKVGRSLIGRFERLEALQSAGSGYSTPVICSFLVGNISAYAMLGLIRNIDVVLVCTSLWPIEVKMVRYSLAADNLFLFLCQLLNEALKAGHAYEMEAPLETLVAVTLSSTSVSLRVIIWPHFSLEDKAEEGIMHLRTNLHNHAYVLYSIKQSKLHTTTSDFLMWSSKHVQIPWDPGDVHNNTFSPRLTQSIVCVCLERPWDPGIIMIHKPTVSDDLNAEVGATKCCNLIEPLLGDKQRFFGAVMSYLSMWLLWA